MHISGLNEKIIEKGLRSLVTGMHRIAIGFDKKGNVCCFNDHFLELTDYEESEVLEKNWFDTFIPQNKRDTVKKVFEAVISNNYHMHSENPIVKKDGNFLHVEWDNAPLINESEEVIGILSIGVDVTGRNEIEELLKVSEEKSRLRSELLERQNKDLEDTKKGMLNLLDDANELQEALQREKKSVERKVRERTQELNEEKARLLASINSFPSGFIATNQDKQIILTNHKLSELFSADTSKWGLEDFNIVLGKEVRINENIEKCLKDKESLLLKDINWAKKIFEIYFAPVFLSQISSEVIGVIILISDVTEEKILERSKDEFFSIASHELRTPITAIRGNIEMLKKYYTGRINDKDFIEMLDDIRDSSTRLIELVNEFLDTSRLEQGKIQFEKEEFNIVPVIKNVLMELTAAAAKKGLNLDFKDKRIPNVYADQDRVKEVLINLVGNAINYTEKGGATVFIDQEDNFVKVSVKDTGKGISEQNQKYLFRKFQQANINLYTRDASHSTGLGLYISKLIIESLGGNIFLESSELEKGSTFTFLLPIAKNEKKD